VVVLIVTLLQSGGRVSVSPLAMVQYFRCQFEYLQCLSMRLPPASPVIQFLG